PTVAIAQALRFTINDGARVRPVYIGYLPADELNDLAAVPSFQPSTAQATIARNIINPPIADWQRPIDETKRDAIAERFSQPNEFMPNPVLLAVHDRQLVNVQQQTLNGQLTQIFEVTV